MKKYIILRANGLDALEDLVNSAMAGQYVPVGGLMRVPGDDRRDHWYAQDMVLK